MEKEEIKYESVTYFNKNKANNENINSLAISNINSNLNINNNKLLTALDAQNTMKKRVYTNDENKICMDLFNPRSFDMYYFTANNWIRVLNYNLIFYLYRTYLSDHFFLFFFHCFLS